jgi:decaprenyl-phosphate phosphoribosyltransferase
MQITSLIRLVRVDQWVKNLFVFIPAFFAARLADLAVLQSAIWVFFAFCLVSGGVYIFNDICDAEQDKLHPEKRSRPIASGAISVAAAKTICALLLIIGIGAAFFLQKQVGFILCLYLAINIAYSLKLKHFALLDVSLIALGFLLRLFAGAEATHVKVSHWLIVLTFLLALILGFAKRRAEYVHFTQNKSTRLALEGYNLRFIDSAMLVSATVAVVAYLMYCFSPEVVQRMGSDRIYFTAFFVIMGLFRYLQLTYVYGKTESPTRALLTDGMLQLTLICWVACFIWVLYLKSA